MILLLILHSTELWMVEGPRLMAKLFPLLLSLGVPRPPPGFKYHLHTNDSKCKPYSWTPDSCIQLLAWHSLGDLLGTSNIIFMPKLPSPPVFLISVSGTTSYKLLKVRTQEPSKMVNLICQLDWATRCPDVCLNIVLVCPWGCFWIRLTFESVDWVDQIVFPTAVGLI